MTELQRPSPEVIAMLERLIAFRTITLESNLDMIEWVRDYLAGLGAVVHLSYDPTKTKANLFATLGEGPGGIVLSGHSDVVSVDGQTWTTDPFTLTETGGRLYGRGAADMKGFIAVALAHAPGLLAHAGREPVHIALSYDEEAGCKGVGDLIADLAERKIRPRACIIGEPTSMDVVLGHKGGASFVFRLTGRESHSALAPYGVNAISYAARAIVRVQDIGRRLEMTEPRHAGFDVPYSTLQTNLISGGIASNIVAKSCEFRVDMRTLPDTAVEGLIGELRSYCRDELLPEMRETAPESDIEIFQRTGVPAASIDRDAPLPRFVHALAESPNPMRFVGFGSEMGLFARAGIPSVLCGPGSIEVAHKPNEYVSLEQLAWCERFIGAFGRSSRELE